jgi:hypothetical protein
MEGIFAAFAAIAASGALDFIVGRFGVSGVATLGAGFIAGFTGLAAFFVRVTRLGGVGAESFGGGGATTGAGGTILDGGFTVGMAGLATCIRRFAVFDVFRAVRAIGFRDRVFFVLPGFGVAAFAVPRAAGNVFGAMNRDFGIAAGGGFSGARLTLRRVGFGGGAVRTAGRVADGIGVFWISPACAGAAGRGVPGAGRPSCSSTDSSTVTLEPYAD